MIQLTQHQQEVVDFLTGLPNASIIDVSEKFSILPDGRGTVSTLIGGGAQRHTLCDGCGRHHYDTVNITVSYRNGRFNSASMTANRMPKWNRSFRSDRVSFTEVKRLVTEATEDWKDKE